MRGFRLQCWPASSECEATPFPGLHLTSLRNMKRETVSDSALAYLYSQVVLIG